MRITVSIGEILLIIALCVAVCTGHLRAGCSTREGVVACGVMLNAKG